MHFSGLDADEDTPNIGLGSINIDLDADEDTPTNKGVGGTPCQLSIGSINNIVAVATIVEDNIGCPNVKVLVDVVTGENLTIPNPVKGKIETLNQALGNIIEWPRRLEHSTRKDVVYPSNYTDVNGIIKLLNRHAMNNMKDVDMIRIPMNELIFGSDKFVYLAREDLLHYCGMVEIGYMCILAYITCLWDKCDCAKNFFVIDQSKISSHIKDRDLRSRNLANQLEAVNLEQKVLIPYNTGFHWMLHVIDLRENCVYVLDSLRSKVNEDIHGIINVGLKTWQAKHDLQRYRSTPKWRPVKCPRQLDSVGCGYYVQKYIHEIVHNSSTSITNLFNTKNAYRQEEIDEIRTEWAAFVSRFVRVERCADILGVYYWFAMDGIVCIAGELGIIVCIAGELGSRKPCRMLTSHLACHAPDDLLRCMHPHVQGMLHGLGVHLMPSGDALVLLHASKSN
ncbi:uncharacterized protein E5676_scaffold1081G00120 [Cucumis melo var. makuwa]|uniref:Ubiquitin-like protease family profile domain-containing protein n=2 Tax=Cucumis melo var. makuwa TaxID=1194695 RepID=A0A5D3CSK7_CUCMM|nr:uncharacterized protein E5676_scaffold1081G00120 [Cucumis melo var. makuwa]